tara:strand:- start:431 stop:649 length:219 start_codon:yes stop_codon:yes gene_type:complete
MMNNRKDPRGQSKNPMNYWVVDITLTSGEELHFYVSAKDKQSAYEKADGYAKLSENESLANFYKRKGFRLLP